MTDSELKKMDKKDLLQMLIDLSDENDRLQEEKTELEEKIRELSAQLERKDLCKAETGNIAEAALKINGVFEATQAAAEDYLVTIREINEKTDEDYRKVIEEAMSQADEILKAAEDEKSKKLQEADSYWAEMSERLDRFTKDHEWFSRLMQSKAGE